MVLLLTQLWRLYIDNKSNVSALGIMYHQPMHPIAYYTKTQTRPRPHDIERVPRSLL